MGQRGYSAATAAVTRVVAVAAMGVGVATGAEEEAETSRRPSATHGWMKAGFSLIVGSSSSLSKGLRNH